MEKTPLELYETAYTLHYVDKKIAEAVTAYEQLIEEFPDSNECGYAAIQLQKIKIGNLSGASLTKASSALHPIAIIALIIACISLIGCGAITYYMKNQITSEHYKSTLAISALSKIFKKDNDRALELLNELKTIDSKDITAFELSADIYRKNRAFKKAYQEYELFFRLNPTRRPSSAELEIMNNDKDAVDNGAQSEKKVDSQKEKEALLNEFIIDTDKKPVRNELATSSKSTVSSQAVVQTNKSKKSVDSTAASNTTKNQAKPQTSNPAVKGLFVVDPDSLSYF
jgi:tetratricopeptide (TPR) repeat protein